MKMQIVSKEFWNWVNVCEDFNEHKKCLDDKSTIGNDKKPNHVTEFGRGYKQACRDIFDKIGVRETKQRGNDGK